MDPSGALERSATMDRDRCLGAMDPSVALERSATMDRDRSVPIKRRHGSERGSRKIYRYIRINIKTIEYNTFSLEQFYIHLPCTFFWLGFSDFPGGTLRIIIICGEPFLL